MLLLRRSSRPGNRLCSFRLLVRLLYGHPFLHLLVKFVDRIGFVRSLVAYRPGAINMFFRNKFGFRRYSILDAEVVNDEQAEFIANFGGYNIMAIATVRETDENGLIQRLTVRPK